MHRRGCHRSPLCSKQPQTTFRVADQSRAKQTLARLSIDFFLCQGLLEKPLFAISNLSHTKSRVDQHCTPRHLYSVFLSLSILSPRHISPLSHYRTRWRNQRRPTTPSSSNSSTMVYSCSISPLHNIPSDSHFPRPPSPRQSRSLPPHIPLPQHALQLPRLSKTLERPLLLHVVLRQTRPSTPSRPRSLRPRLPPLHPSKLSRLHARILANHFSRIHRY